MRYFEDFEVGYRFEAGRYELTREDIIEFAQKWDPQPFHLDENLAQETSFGGLTASGCHLISITVRLIMQHPKHAAVIAALGWDDVRFYRPGRPGDELILTVECMEARLSKSDPSRGVIRNRFVLTNQNGEEVLSYTDTILVKRRATQGSHR